MGLLTRLKESAAIRCIETTLQAQGSLEEGIAATRRLSDFGGERCVPLLGKALVNDNLPLQIQAARAMAAVYQRHSDERILKNLNTSVLNERQHPQARQAAIESLGAIVDYRHAGSLVEVLRSNRSPLPVRSAALRCLKRMGYPEILERLIETVLFGKRLDPRGALRQWAIRELIALDDHEKLSKIREIIHGRHKLRYRALSHVTGGPATLVLLMARIDPRGARRLLDQLVDDANPAIRAAAAQALHDIKARDVPTA